MAITGMQKDDRIPMSTNLWRGKRLDILLGQSGHDCLKIVHLRAWVEDKEHLYELFSVLPSPPPSLSPSLSLLLRNICDGRRRGDSFLRIRGWGRPPPGAPRTPVSYYQS